MKHISYLDLFLLQFFIKICFCCKVQHIHCLNFFLKHIFFFIYLCFCFNVKYIFHLNVFLLQCKTYFSFRSDSVAMCSKFLVKIFFCITFLIYISQLDLFLLQCAAHFLFRISVLIAVCSMFLLQHAAGFLFRACMFHCAAHFLFLLQFAAYFFFRSVSVVMCSTYLV